MVARGFGFQAARVTTDAELDAALKQALASGQPWLIDAMIDGELPGPGFGRRHFGGPLSGTPSDVPSDDETPSATPTSGATEGTQG